MNLTRLEGFYWVAREGGYSAAARAFPRPITQPAIHQQVRRLEEELEVDLFERVASRRVRLTPAGERLYDFCAPFFEALPDVIASVRSEEERRRLRIEAAGLVLRQLLPPWIRKVRKTRDDLDLEVTQLVAPDLDRLRSGAIDLLIDHLPAVPRDVEARTVAETAPFIVVPRDHPVAVGAKKGDALDLSALSDTPFVCYSPSLHQHTLQMAAVREHIGLPDKTIAASSVDVILAFVAAGLGYSIIPWLDPKGPRRAGVVALAPEGHDQRFPIHAAWSRRHPATPTIEQILALF